MKFNGKVQKTDSVQTANCSKGFKRFHTMNIRVLSSETITHLRKNKNKFNFYKLKWSPCSARSWLSCSNSFIKMNKSFFVSFGSFSEWNERVDSGKDSLILMNEFELESHEPFGPRVHMEKILKCFHQKA